MSTSVAVFVIEDEALIRMMTIEMLEELGHRIAAEADSIKEGRLFAETAVFDLALLDVNIGGHNIAPIAEILERRGLPFVFVSGYTATALPKSFGNRPLLHKPFQITHLRQAIEAALKSP
jgi:CheY-like chemotaxis protein